MGSALQLHPLAISVGGWMDLALAVVVAGCLDVAGWVYRRGPLPSVPPVLRPPSPPAPPAAVEPPPAVALAPSASFPSAAEPPTREPPASTDGSHTKRQQIRRQQVARYTYAVAAGLTRLWAYLLLWRLWCVATKVYRSNRSYQTTPHHTTPQKSKVRKTAIIIIWSDLCA